MGWIGPLPGGFRCQAVELGSCQKAGEEPERIRNPCNKRVFSTKRALLKGAYIGGNNLMEFLVAQYIFKPGFVRECEVLSSRQNRAILS